MRLRHRGLHQPTRARGSVGKRRLIASALAAVIAVAIAIASVETLRTGSLKQGGHPTQPRDGTSVTTDPNKLPAAPGSYLGVYVPGAPISYSGLTTFTKTTGIRPNLVSYYSGWFEPFSTSFADAAAEHGATLLVQMNPRGVSVAAIAAGDYDTYLTSFAESVRSYHHPLILSFGHEMNGQWYTWGYKHTSPATFIAAWRHIFNVFEAVGDRNVTWMWTVNVIDRKGRISGPRMWWPGSSYVNWVGIDGYFHKASSQFYSVFGPTIALVREFTQDPILISETGAGQEVRQSAKIESLFRGVHLYGLVGFLWFDAVGNADYRLISQASIAALRLGAKSDGVR
jgi:mannan endo-1,4-beta-mannosidase